MRCWVRPGRRRLRVCAGVLHGPRLLVPCAAAAQAQDQKIPGGSGRRPTRVGSSQTLSREFRVPQPRRRAAGPRRPRRACLLLCSLLRPHIDSRNRRWTAAIAPQLLVSCPAASPTAAAAVAAPAPVTLQLPPPPPPPRVFGGDCSISRCLANV